jgi:hypothetical protein
VSGSNVYNILKGRKEDKNSESQYITKNSSLCFARKQSAGDKHYIEELLNQGNFFHEVILQLSSHSQ